MELSPTEAQELVERIAREYGRLSERDREVTPQVALGAIANLQDALGATTQTILTDLQKNKTRFVFELIKNAEDNHYQNSAISHGAPHIHFSLYPDKIVVSNNEDGFTVENIKAICKIAGSTKTRTDSLSYIGEEGIGFKSVFMVASKAHIQSGPFTFFFEHPSSRDASGMGMVSPVWHNYDARAKHSGTKITLNLRNDVNRSELENQLFTDLPDTLLLFLKKLQRISIDKYDASGLLLRHTEYTCDRDDVNRKVTLTKSTLTRGSSPLKTVTRYFTTTKKLSMLPSDTQKTFNTAELVLAFPVQEGDVAPRIASKHDIYSYLSIRNSGFPFVIHSDFVTKAYGQGVMDCPRNEAIFDEAALGFVDAVVQFCQHSTLQYQWMRYLPKASIFDGFSWKLTSKIEELLRKTPVLRPHNHGPLSLISELRILPDEFKDAFSEPLFPDSPKGTYIAKGYQVGDDMSSLISLGLKTLELVDVMERLQQDLESPSSIYKAKETIKDWHTRAAKYLMTAFNGDCIPHVKKMKFIPLENGEFTSVSEGPVYFPNSDGLPIPTDLGLRLVKPEAIEDNTWRKTLFTALGVTEVSTQQVRKLIFEKYKSEASREKITVYRSVAHLRFLYWTHQDSLPRPKITGFGTLSGFGAATVGSGTAAAATTTSSPFGTAPATTRSSGLFGTATTTTSVFGTAPATTGNSGLFGTAPPTSSPFETVPPATGGLFGGTASSQPSPWGSKPTGGFGSDKPAVGLFGSTGTAKPVSPFGATAFSPSGFGSTLPIRPSNSLFGDSNQSTPKPATGFGGFGGSSLFGGSNSTPTQQAGSLFGAQSTPKPTSGFGGSGLFGGTNSTGGLKARSLFGSGSTATPSGSSLFGNPNQNAPNPAGASPFGGLNATGGQKTGSLFGSGSTATPSGSSLFGNPNQSTPKPASPFRGSSLFGGSNSIGGQQPLPSGFGSAVPITSSNSLFGNPNPNALKPASAFGSSSVFGGLNSAGSQKTGSPFGSGFAGPTTSGTSLFGNLDQRAPKPASGFGSPSPFGGLNSTNNQNPGSLFGSSSTAVPSSSSLFGNPNQSASNLAPASSGSFSFGGSSSAGTQKPGPAIGFGSTAPIGSSTSLFGNSNQSTSKPASPFGGSSLPGGLNSTEIQKSRLSFGFDSAGPTSSGNFSFGNPSSTDASKPLPIIKGITPSPLGTNFLSSSSVGPVPSNSNSKDAPKPASTVGAVPKVGSTATSSSAFGVSSSANKAVPLGDIKSSSNPFGSTSNAATHQPVTWREITNTPGTQKVPFQPTVEDEPYSTKNQQNVFQSIGFQQQYKKFSYEELRLADYQSSDIREYHDLWIFDQGRLVPCHSDVYFDSEEEFGIRELSKLSQDMSYLGPSLSLLNSAYFDVVPKKASGNLSWESWLQIYLGIVRHPCLSDPNDPSKLSPIFKYLVDHRPEKLLRILKANWASYEEMLSPKLTKVISNMDIPVMDGSRRKLNTTFLPALETRAQKFLRGEEKLGVLILDSLSNAEEWRFLEKFGVSHTDNLDFYLALLSYITEENEDAEELSDPERIFELYEVIFSGQWSPEGNPGHEERIRSYFETHPALYIPSTNRRPREWMRSLGCLWDAPSYLVYHPSIMHIKEYSGNVILATSMRRILKLPNVDQEWLISELTGLTIGGNYLDNKDFIDIYQRLDMFQMEMDEKKRSAMIKEFRTEKLIFVPTQGWFSLEECLWRDSIEIQGKVAIKAQYPTLRHFFVDFLGILAPDMGVLVKELKEVATSSRSVEKAKALIWQISSMGPTAEDLASIYDSAIFPVKIGNEAVRLANRATEFAIVDNLKLARAFTTPISIGVLAVLDFSTVDEIHKLQPFLAGLKIENRYLSSIVEEITSLPGDANSSSEYAAALTADLRHRAYALSRCVFHFRSSEKQDDDRSVYEMLLGAKIFTASEIRTRYELTQNGKKFQAILDKGTLHIEKDETQLNIYVPENSRDRELCYRRLLPSRLLAKLMRDESAITTIYLDLRAVAIVADIMTCSDLIIEDLLEDAGIMRLSFPAENMSNNVPKSSLDIPKPGQVARQSDEDEISHAQAGQTAPEESPKEPKSGRFSSLPSLSGSKPREVGQRSHSNGQPTIPTVSLSQDQVLVTDLLDVNGNTPDYCRLLDDLISAATNRHGKFPSKDGLFDVKGLASALPLNQPIYDSPFGVKDENRLAYNLRIGAAGELYVFEILKRLNPPLPRFSDSNWKSSIRKYVTVHESYQDMGAWEGYEQSDIMYNDIKGEFTQLLIDNGYLDGKVWANAKPRYSLEVKSTTGDCETTFFLSIGQYQRMQRMKLTDRNPAAEVYIILRVFNLDKSNADMRIYVDPAGTDGLELYFTFDEELNRYCVDHF